MSLAVHAAVVAGQWLACVLSAAGWGYWIHRWCRQPAADATDTAPLLCSVAGACGGWLLLQDALPLGVPLRWSAPVAAGVAAAGLVGWYRNGRFDAGPRTRPLVAGLVLLAGVFSFQAAGLIYAGARDYYGYARQDQVNYVQLAQFLVEKPYSTDGKDVGLHPWLVKGVDTKSQRIGESVADGYLASVTGSDAAATYGTTSVFFVALLAVSVCGCLRAYGASLRSAWLGGAWAGVLPGITQTQLDGFFSQTSTLFCFVGIAWALRLAARNPRLAAGATVLLLGFLLAAYSEEYVLGLGLAWALIAVDRALPRRGKLGLAAVVLVAPWLCLAPFAGGIVRFTLGQYHAAQHGDALAVWQPRAGTWRGWNELFWAAPAHAPALLAFAAVAGGGVLLLVAVGAARSEPGETGAAGRLQRAVLLLFPAAVLGVLVGAARPGFPTYAFGKLAVSFCAFAVVLVVCALELPVLRRGIAALLILFIGLGAWSSWTKLAVVFRNGAGLPTMNSPAARAVYRELDAHPERTYLITEPHGMLNSWFAYHARHAAVYSTVPIGDSPMEPGFAFLQRPPAGVELWEVSNAGVKRIQ